ncbi:MAG: hypothetical protein AAFQ61_04215 [Cyanobacteria bacterium J06626_23]
MEQLPRQADFHQWLTEEIRKLSVETLSKAALTCTACGEIEGNYVIEYQGAKLSCSPEQAYAYLVFVAQSD